MLIWLTVLLYPAALLMLAVLLTKRISLFIMLWTQFLLLLVPLIRLAAGLPAFSGFDSSVLVLALLMFVGVISGWPLAEKLRLYIDHRRESITNTIILSRAFNSAFVATLVTTLLNLCWQQLTLGWPIINTPIGNWIGSEATLIVLVICLVAGLIGLPRYLNSVLYRR